MNADNTDVPVSLSAVKKRRVPHGGTAARRAQRFQTRPNAPWLRVFVWGITWLGGHSLLPVDERRFPQIIHRYRYLYLRLSVFISVHLWLKNGNFLRGFVPLCGVNHRLRRFPQIIHIIHRYRCLNQRLSMSISVHLWLKNGNFLRGFPSLCGGLPRRWTEGVFPFIIFPEVMYGKVCL